MAIASLLAAGLDGFERKLPLEDEFVGNAYKIHAVPKISKTLRDAVEALHGSKMLKDTFGDSVIDHYVHSVEWEQFEFDR